MPNPSQVIVIPEKKIGNLGLFPDFFLGDNLGIFFPLKFGNFWPFPLEIPEFLWERKNTLGILGLGKTSWSPFGREFGNLGLGFLGNFGEFWEGIRGSGI